MLDHANLLFLDNSIHFGPVATDDSCLQLLYHNFSLTKPLGELSFSLKHQETLISKWCFLPPECFPLEIKPAQ